ncbi:MAG: DUF362 domain-containing protein [Acutalibacteraceae bacterium]
MNRAYLIRQGGYDLEALEKAADRIFSAFGFYARLAPGRQVILKPNLVMKSAPEEAIITHPKLVAAVALCLKRRGAEVLVAESGGGVYNTAAMKSVFRACGYTAAAEQYGFSLYTECRSQTVELPRGVRCGALSVLEPFVQPREALVVNIAKLKTHGMMGYSGAVKNLFGTVPGLMKPELHCRYPEKEPFAEMLVDLCDYIRADFSFIDGIEAMEGNGPTGGEKRFVGALIGAESPYAADLAGAAVIGMRPEEILTLQNACARGLCADTPLELLGDPLESVRVPDFKRARSSDVDFLTRVPKPLRPLAKKIATPYPCIRRKSCVGCGKCAESCPQHTIELRGGKAQIGYARCIRCFCCHEMCPKHVIDIRRFSVFNL